MALTLVVVPSKLLFLLDLNKSQTKTTNNSDELPMAAQPSGELAKVSIILNGFSFKLSLNLLFITSRASNFLNIDWKETVKLSSFSSNRVP